MEKGGPAALVPASEKRFADLLSTSQEHKSGALSHSRSKRPRLTGTAHVCDAEICFGILNLEMLNASIIKNRFGLSRAKNASEEARQKRSQRKVREMVPPSGRLHRRRKPCGGTWGCQATVVHLCTRSIDTPNLFIGTYWI